MSLATQNLSFGHGSCLHPVSRVVFERSALSSASVFLASVSEVYFTHRDDNFVYYFNFESYHTSMRVRMYREIITARPRNDE